MLVGIGIDFEIRDNRPDNLVVRPLAASKWVQLLFENKKQLFYVAMFLVLKINDHRFGLRARDLSSDGNVPGWLYTIKPVAQGWHSVPQ
jgi:hypothetical protein